MNKINKNDKVIIVNTNNIWEGKSGTVLNISDETLTNNDGDDVTDVTVKVNFDSENPNKNIVQIFPMNCLELYNIENLNESKKESIAVDLNSKDNFKNYFINKKCRFKGFNYSELYNKHKQKDGLIDYNKEDLEEINYYKELEKLECKIIGCVLLDSFRESESIEENFNAAYWSVEFSNGDILSAICGSDLELIDVLFESLNTTAEQNIDYIKDYVYAESMSQDTIPSWFFANKIAAAENINEDDVLKTAKYFNYKIYAIIANQFYKKVIAAPGCTDSTIYNDYADYLNGTVTIKEI